MNSTLHDDAVNTTRNESRRNATPRKSRLLSRKTSHSVIERRRRDKINEGLIHLQDTVPACRQELKELLECKVKMNKKNAKKSPDEIQVEIDRLFNEKSASEMVLEKLCIISHTVDYVQELQGELKRYRQWCGSSSLPENPNGNLIRAHDGAHSQDRDNLYATTISEVGEASRCVDCASGANLKGKRHWGSDNPLRLKRGGNTSVAVDEDQEEVFTMQQIPSKKTRVSPREGSNDVSDFELDDWHGTNKLYASQLYTDIHSNHFSGRNILPRTPSDREFTSVGLGLLAQVSLGTKRAKAVS